MKKIIIALVLAMVSMVSTGECAVVENVVGVGDTIEEARVMALNGATANYDEYSWARIIEYKSVYDGNGNGRVVILVDVEVE